MKRYALFVGIDKYANDITPLSCASKDAMELSLKFAAAGFETPSLMLDHNAGSVQIVSELNKLCGKLRKDDLLLFYFAGHGRELGGEHFLVCKDGFADPSFYNMDSLPMSVLISATNKPGVRRLFILDCCRDNLLSGRSTTFVCGADRGIALERAIGREISADIIPPLILNSCAAGEKAFENRDSGHGYFTEALLKTIADKAVNSFSLFRRRLAANMNQQFSQNICWNGNVDSWDNVKLFPAWGETLQAILLPPEKTDALKAVPPKEFAMPQSVQQQGALPKGEDPFGVLKMSVDGRELLRCIQPTIESIEIPEGVVKIGSFAFTHCSQLKKVVFPSSLREIGYSAFDNCGMLTDIELPSGLEKIGKNAFFGCRELSMINIPPGVKSIGRYAFASCWNLQGVGLPQKSLKIGAYAFENCNSLISVFISRGIIAGGRVFPKSCRVIREKQPFGVHLIFQLSTFFFGIVFGGLSASLANFTFSPAILGLSIFFAVPMVLFWVFFNILYFHKWAAFPKFMIIPALVIAVLLPIDRFMMQVLLANTGLLSSVSIPRWIGQVPQNSFYFSNLSRAKIPVDCTFKSRAFPADCRIIGRGAEVNDDESAVNTADGNEAASAVRDMDIREVFLLNDDGNIITGLKDKTVTELVIPPEIRKIDGEAFVSCAGIRRVIINGDIEIGGWAFVGCRALNEVKFNGKITKISAGMFENCVNLTMVNIPDGTWCIDSWAFAGCESLQSVIIPDSVSQIGASAFAGCSSLGEVELSADCQYRDDSFPSNCQVRRR